MNDTQVERMVKAIERIAEALDTINEYGVLISTVPQEPIEIKGQIYAKE